MRWDDAAGRLVAASFRDWEHDTDDPPSRRAQTPPITTSMVAMLLVGACQDRDNAFESLQAVVGLYQRGAIGSEAVQQALRSLGSHELLSPAHLVRIIEQHPTTLPAAWPILQQSIREASNAPAHRPD